MKCILILLQKMLGAVGSNKVSQSTIPYAFFLKKAVWVLILARIRCVRSDAFFFPSYAGEASAGILCSSLGQHILKPVDKSGPAVGA